MAPRKRRESKRLLSSKEVSDTVKLLVSRARRDGIRIAVLGGVAMNFYGSPRLTSDVDFVGDSDLQSTDDFDHVTTLSFGGNRYIVPGKIPVDLIVRDDDQAALYEAALDAAEDTEEGFLIVSPEYMAAIKFGAQRGKDQDDLLWLLAQTDIVDAKKAEAIVRQYLGGSFAAKEFRQAVHESKWRSGEGEYRGKLEKEDDGSEE
jgi:hypothetical protein